MTRYARKVDANHREIVRALRRLGCTVLDLSSHGRDVPDLAVGYRGVVTLIELKNPQNKGSTRGLSAGQRRWLAEWPGPTAVLWSVEDAVAWVTGSKRPEVPKWAKETR